MAAVYSNALGLFHLTSKATPIGADLIPIGDTAVTGTPLKQATISSILSAGSASALTWIASATASASSVINFSNDLTSTYDNYLLSYENVVLTGGNLFTINFQIGTTSTPTYQASNYVGQILAGSNATASSVALPASTNVGMNINGADAGSPQGLSGAINIYGVNNGTVYKVFTYVNSYDNSSGNWEIDICGAQWSTGTVLTSIRFQPNGSTIASGIFKLYGYQN